MDLNTGTFLNWPMGGSYEKNKHYLPLMYSTWRTWEHWLRTRNPKREWTYSDMLYEEWLMQDRPKIRKITQAQEWARENGYG